MNLKVYRKKTFWCLEMDLNDINHAMDKWQTKKSFELRYLYQIISLWPLDVMFKKKINNINEFL
jgi:hypothetical protein